MTVFLWWGGFPLLSIFFTFRIIVCKILAIMDEVPYLILLFSFLLWSGFVVLTKECIPQYFVCNFPLDSFVALKCSLFRVLTSLLKAPITWLTVAYLFYFEIFCQTCYHPVTLDTDFLGSSWFGLVCSFSGLLRPGGIIHPDLIRELGEFFKSGIFLFSVILEASSEVKVLNHLSGITNVLYDYYWWLMLVLVTCIFAMNYLTFAAMFCVFLWIPILCECDKV